MSTPFELDRGTRQGRMLGGYELGHADRVSANLALGDKHEVSQTFTIGATGKLVQVIAQVRMPDELPDGMSWEFAVLLNGDVHYSRLLDLVGHSVELHPVVRLRGAPAAPATNVITLRLRLV